jgi:peptide/nickel transport system ATP-binding protein
VATTALDVMVQAQVLQLISDLVTERGVGLVMISHDLSVLSSVCDRAAVMYAGRIVEEGPAHEVFANARHPYSAALGAAFPVIGDPAARKNPGGLAGDPPDPKRLPDGCSFRPRCAVAVERCGEEPPELLEVDTARVSACFVAQEGEPIVVR